MTIEDVALAAKAAGFEHDQLVTAVAGAGAETDGTFDAAATDDTRRFTALAGVKGEGPWHWTDPQTGESLLDYVDPEYSVGPWQIDLIVHTDITEADARDYGKAAAYVYALSRQGTDFTPWSTFSGGAYHAYLEAAHDILGQQAGADAQAASEAAAPPPATEPLPFGDTEWTVIYESVKGAIPSSGLPFSAELVDGHFTGDSTEEWTLRLHGRPR